ncbi:protein Z-dependent protease inhibitor [Hemicordylus capensis]|uniref:protein Z-dependent protease inhibitor n=1 Tax=Hemicordylus capensis TaxID=884348 RepID=UPI002304074A|nr:protein Z-dependent protease inhibitor [Hemicordylus capensis]
MDQSYWIPQSKREADLLKGVCCWNPNMKTGFFLVFFKLCVGMCLSDRTAELSEMETQQPILWPSNGTDKQYSYNNAPDPPGEESTLVVSMYNFTGQNANFGFNLYRKIAMKHDNNMFFSPLSLSFSLAALMLASKGETRDQIVQSLNFQLPRGKEHQLLVLFQQLRGNISKNEESTLLQDSFSFIQKDFRIKDVFRNLSKEYFDMEILTVDFQNSTLAKDLINQHIKQKTRGKIPKLFDGFDEQAKIILVNCILFRGKWLNPFPSKATALEPFFIDNYRTVQVPMMFKTERVASTFDKNLHCYVLKLPYRGSVHMLVVMPGRENDYMSLEDHLTNELVESWLRHMKIRKMDIYFPKFRLDQKYHMDQLLQDLGIKDVFSYKADLSHLTDQKYVKVSQVLQRAVIEVDEIGTDAAAASGSEIIAYSMPPVIRMNRPFLFMIYEESMHALLFVGRVVDPTAL